MLRVEVTPKGAPLGGGAEDYLVDDCDFVSFINDGTYGIPGGGKGEGTLIREIERGSKVLFVNTSTVEKLTIEEVDA
jgi:hypothetical protein